MLLAIFIAIFICLIFFLYHRLTFWSRQGVKGPHTFGLEGYTTDQNAFLLEQDRKYGRVYGGNLMTTRFLAINDPELIKEIFIKNDHIFADHNHYNLGTSSKTTKMLFFLPGDENWKRIRQVISPAFTAGKLKSMCSHMADISDDFVNKLKAMEKQGGEVDFRISVGAYTMDVISVCCYGVKIDSKNDQDNPLTENARIILGVDASPSQIISIFAPKLAKLLRLEFFDMKAINYFGELTKQIISDRKLKQKYSTSKVTDFIQLMLDSEVSDKDVENDFKDETLDESQEQTPSKPGPPLTLTLDELTAQAIMFFIAGYDTTGSAMCHMIHYLAENQECQEKLYQELKDLTDFSYDNLNQLKYLNAVINETLRLAPSALRVQRVNIRDFEINGIKIPKGTSVEYFPGVLHRDPEYWTDPLEFKPDRFLEPTHNPYAYLPFGLGHRHCPGKRFTMNEIRICAAKLFKEFVITPKTPGTIMEYFNGSPVLTPKSVLTYIKSRK